MKQLLNVSAKEMLVTESTVRMMADRFVNVIFLLDVQGTLSVATYAATEKIAYGRDPSVKNVIVTGVVSGVMAGGMKFLAQEAGAVQCFVAGTLVAAKPGLIPIEKIQAGDLVWATDPDTSETALKRVVRTFKNESEELVHLTVNGEEIVTTPGHPFYVPVKGWTKAIQLRAGDRLQLLNGQYVVVEQVQHELLESPETTYNFEVSDFHTYYVGSTTVLVHNICKAAKEAGLPTEGKIRYVPPKNTNGVLPRTSSGGYIDKFGNVWQKGAIRFVCVKRVKKAPDSVPAPVCMAYSFSALSLFLILPDSVAEASFKPVFEFLRRYHSFKTVVAFA